MNYDLAKCYKVSSPNTDEEYRFMLDDFNVLGNLRSSIFSTHIFYVMKVDGLEALKGISSLARLGATVMNNYGLLAWEKHKKVDVVTMRMRAWDEA